MRRQHTPDEGLRSPFMGDAVPHVLIVGAGDTGLSLATMLSSAGLRGRHSTDRVVRSMRQRHSSAISPTASPAWDCRPPTLSCSPQPAVACTTRCIAPPTSTDPSGCSTPYPPSQPERYSTSTTGVYGADDGRWVTARPHRTSSRSTAAIVVEGEAALARRIRPPSSARPASSGPESPPSDRSGVDRRRGRHPDARPLDERVVHRDDLPRAPCASSIEPAAGCHRRRRRAGATRRRAGVVAARCGSIRRPFPDRRPTGKRSEQRTQGPRMELSYPTFREGYASVLATSRAYVEAHPEEEGEGPPRQATTAASPTWAATADLRPFGQPNPTNAAGFSWRRLRSGAARQTGLPPTDDQTRFTPVSVAFSVRPGRASVTSSCSTTISPAFTVAR